MQENNPLYTGSILTYTVLKFSMFLDYDIEHLLSIYTIEDQRFYLFLFIFYLFQPLVLIRSTLFFYTIDNKV